MNFTAELQQGLSRYIINPDITVNVSKLGGVRVYVFGEINKPGAYTLTNLVQLLMRLGLQVVLLGYSKEENLLDSSR